MDACGLEAFTTTLKFTHIVEDRGATHEGTQIEEKPPAAEEEEVSKTVAKRTGSRTQRWSLICREMERECGKGKTSSTKEDRRGKPPHPDRLGEAGFHHLGRLGGMGPHH